MKVARVLVVVLCVMAAVNVASADTIRGINMEFVTIGNAGNAPDTTTGYGEVSYNYRIGTYEVTNAQWNAFTDAAGAPTGNPSSAYNQNAEFTEAGQPTNNVSWYEAAQFCNYLTSGNKSLGAYQLGTDGSITINRAAAVSAYGTVYVIPTENEWVKAAYWNGSALQTYATKAGESLYQGNGSNGGWNYWDGNIGPDGPAEGPWNVGSGSQELNGTYDMMGNVSEWHESPSSISQLCFRGGDFKHAEQFTTSGPKPTTINFMPFRENNNVGFRVASIPEPASAMVMILGTAWIAAKRKR